MSTNGGLVVGVTAAIVGWRTGTLDALWLVLLGATALGTYASVFRLVRTITEGPSEPRPPLPKLNPRRSGEPAGR